MFLHINNEHISSMQKLKTSFLILIKLLLINCSSAGFSLSYSKNDNFKKSRWIMFNKIAKTYDFINRLITFGMDINWRNHIVKLIPKTATQLLDIASGTMDVALTAAKKRPNLSSIIALDMAENMLDIGLNKCHKKGVQTISKCVADIHDLPFDSNRFDSATVSFGIRNFENLDQAFKETHRVLVNEGFLLF